MIHRAFDPRSLLLPFAFYDCNKTKHTYNNGTTDFVNITTRRQSCHYGYWRRSPTRPTTCATFAAPRSTPCRPTMSTWGETANQITIQRNGQPGHAACHAGENTMITLDW